MLIQLKEFHCDIDSLEKGAGEEGCFFVIVMNNYSSQVVRSHFSSKEIFFVVKFHYTCSYFCSRSRSKRFSARALDNS